MNTRETILQRVARGEAHAVDELLERYGGLVYALARRFSFEPGEIDDAVQDVFVPLWQSAGRYDENIAGEETFVAMVTRRRLIDRRRRAQRRSAHHTEADVSGMAGD